MKTAKSFADLGIEIRAGGRAEQRAACPQCNRGSGDDALAVNIELGVYYCHRCHWGGHVGSGTPATLPRVVRYDDPVVAERKRQRLKTIWRDSVPLSDPKAVSVCRYLQSRGLEQVLANPPDVLRAHAGLPYWDGTQVLGTYPAMVALFHGATGQPVTLHRTFLRQDGCAKAEVPSVRKLMDVPVPGATRGGAIHLYEPINGVLGIAEGVESALSLHVLRRIPVWAAYCAGNVEHVQLPPELRELHIAIDIDISGTGERAARALAARVKSLHPTTNVTLWWPDISGPGDLNDELLRQRAG